MTIKASSGLRNHMMATGSFKSAMETGDSCKLRVYQGTEPVSANDSVSGATLLLEITQNGEGGGLQFDASAANGQLLKDEAQVWSGEVIVNGTPNFYRLVAVDDTGGLSTTQPRLQGTVGLAGADLNFSSINFVQGAPKTINSYVVALPSLV